jgi:hypothetical protein
MSMGARKAESLDWLKLAFLTVQDHAKAGRWFEAWQAWLGVGQELIIKQRDAAREKEKEAAREEKEEPASDPA